jgi:riboflavin synthase
MFTGIVEEIGIVKEANRDRLALEAHVVLEGTKVGDSIAVNGVCLTVVSLEDRRFGVDVMPERALVLGGRLGGHLVLGHVDGTGEVLGVSGEEGARIMKISAPAELMSYMVDKGFVAVDGVSLTIVEIDAPFFVVSLVGYTMEKTTLGTKTVGDVVNLEADVIAKYVENLKEQRRQGLSIEFLREYGFVGGIDAG